MNTKQLEYFLTTIQTKSIASAARRMDVAQPAISQQIASLERTLGATLLYRDYRGVYPTAAGELFAEHAHNILLELNIAKSNIAELSSTEIEVKVGMMPSIGNVLTMPLIDSLGKSYPNIKLDISTGPSYSVSGWLETKKIDVALTYEQAFSTSFMKATPLIEEFMYLIIGTEIDNPKYYPLLEKSQIPFWALSDFEILIPSNKDALGIFIEKYEKASAISLQRDQHYTGQLMTGLRQVTMGKALTILPSSAVYHLEEKHLVRSIKIIEPEMRRRVLAITNRNSAQSNAVNDVIKEIKSVVKEVQRANLWRGQLC